MEIVGYEVVEARIPYALALGSVNFRTCSNEEDVKCKLLEWFSRPAAKGIPYSQEWRNKKFRKFMLDGINQFLGTKFSFDDMYIIYQYLGNCCNHEKQFSLLKIIMI